MLHILKDAKDIWNRKELIMTLAQADFKRKFVGSFLGIFWMFIQPIVTVLIYFFVFQLGFRSQPVSEVPYVLWLIPGIVPWFFFNEAWGGATNCLYEYQHLVKKMVFKISILPIIKVMSSLFIHLIFIWIMIIVYLLFGMKPSLWWIQLLYYTLCTLFLVLGLSYITASSNAFLKIWGKPYRFYFKLVCGLHQLCGRKRYSRKRSVFCLSLIRFTIWWKDIGIVLLHMRDSGSIQC